MKEKLAKLGLDKHHRIEQFGVIFSVLTSLLVIVFGTILVKAHGDAKQLLSDNVIYTQSFTTSKTNISGDVKNIYVNDDRTRVFMLLKFADMTAMSTDAANYQMFLTAVDSDLEFDDMLVDPLGSIYMFGSSGYMGIYLTDSRGFGEQVLNLIVRNNKELTGDVSAPSSGKNPGDLFSEFDQFSVYFNPGGKAASIAEFLNQDGPMDVMTVYEELITRPREAELRETLSADLREMCYDMELIVEYSKRVKNGNGEQNVVVNNPPEAILGDRILDGEGNIVASLDMNDETISVKDDAALYLSSEYVAPKGVHFDWRNGSVKEGYIDALRGNMTLAQYLSSVKNDAKVADFSIGNMAWYFADGTVFDHMNGATSVMSGDKELTANIENLTSAWTTYWQHKQKYETVDLVNLLMLEAEVISSDTNFTVNDSEDVLYNW